MSKELGSVGLIDVDVMVYRACAISLKENQDVCRVFDEMLDNLIADTGCTTYSLHISNGGNFRKELKQGFTKYKGKRKDKPANYKFLRDYIFKTQEVISVANLEADDTISIEATNYLKQGRLFMIISVDKDLKNVGGLFYNTHHKSLSAISNEEAIDHFHRQLITGDSIDNIPGIVGVGEVKVAKLFKGKDLKEQFDAVINMYQEYHPEDWLERLNAMGAMLYIKKEYEEPLWTIDFWSKYLDENLK